MLFKHSISYNYRWGERYISKVVLVNQNDKLLFGKHHIELVRVGKAYEWIFQKLGYLGVVCAIGFPLIFIYKGWLQALFYVIIARKFGVVTTGTHQIRERILGSGFKKSFTICAYAVPLAWVLQHWVLALIILIILHKSVGGSERIGDSGNDSGGDGC